MYRFIRALIFGLLFSAQCFAQQSFIGTYKAVSVRAEYEGGRSEEPYGKSLHGYLVITPKLYVTFFTSGDRKPGKTTEEKAALLDSLAGFTGPYRMEGNKMIISVDSAWTEVWKGTEQVRNLEVKGKRLTSTSPPVPSARIPGAKVVIRSEWEKVE